MINNLISIYYTLFFPIFQYIIYFKILFINKIYNTPKKILKNYKKIVDKTLYKWYNTIDNMVILVFLGDLLI